MNRPQHDVVFVSLDLETSGTDHDLSVPIQIGLALDPISTRATGMFVGGWDWKRYEWTEESEKIHQIPRDLIDAAVPANMVDGLMAHWLWSRLPEYAQERRAYVVPVGWNIAGFDLPFVRKHFPILSNLLGYRTLDLNAVCFFLGGKRGWYAFKQEAKGKGLDILKALDEGGNYYSMELAHDAQFDALLAMASLKALGENLPWMVED
jgi:hypothetical protein